VQRTMSLPRAHLIRAHAGGLVGVDDDDVRVEARGDSSLCFPPTRERGRRLRPPARRAPYAALALRELEAAYVERLHPRAPRRRLAEGCSLLLVGVRRMVGRNDPDHALG